MKMETEIVPQSICGQNESGLIRAYLLELVPGKRDVTELNIFTRFLGGDHTSPDVVNVGIVTHRFTPTGLI
jgi:hypothetical protein